MPELGISLSSLTGLITSPYLMGLILLAVPLGMFFGAMPGLGGKLGIVIMIPFVFGMESTAGAVFLLAMHAVVHTGGSLTSILFGIPGTGPDATTIVDGHPLAIKGQAGRALGASLAASGFGGVIGALVMMLLLPVFRPIALNFGSGEIFLVTVLGILFIAILSGKQLIAGLIIGCLGLMCSFIGMDPLSGQERFTFGQLYLWDGLDLITAVIGLFALPEVIELLTRQTGHHARFSYGMQDTLRGMLEVLEHKWLALRTAIMGAVLGMIPGLGGDVAAWMCYGHAVQSSERPEEFGQGRIEGVIAPETANNSKEGGALLPTLFLGIPGSSGMAIMLGALIMLGIQPGPQLAFNGEHLVWTLVWALVLANLIAVVFFLVLAGPMATLTTLRSSFLAPPVTLLMITGCLLSSAYWQTLLVLLCLGGLGLILKHLDWPRAPFVIGLVLGGTAETSLNKAYTIWGWGFLLEPVALILLGLIIASLVFYLWRRTRS